MFFHNARTFSAETIKSVRAGQHGKGFAVVAGEVRTLASRSAKAAKETAALIETSNKQILSGSDIANQTAKALDEITKMIDGATELVSQQSGQAVTETVAASQQLAGIVRQLETCCKG